MSSCISSQHLSLIRPPSQVMAPTSLHGSTEVSIIVSDSSLLLSPLISSKQTLMAWPSTRISRIRPPHPATTLVWAATISCHDYGSASSLTSLILPSHMSTYSWHIIEWASEGLSPVGYKPKLLCFSWLHTIWLPTVSPISYSVAAYCIPAVLEHTSQALPQGLPTHCSLWLAQLPSRCPRSRLPQALTQKPPFPGHTHQSFSPSHTYTPNILYPPTLHSYLFVLSILHCQTSHTLYLPVISLFHLNVTYVHFCTSASEHSIYTYPINIWALSICQFK